MLLMFGLQSGSTHKIKNAKDFTGYASTQSVTVNIPLRLARAPSSPQHRTMHSHTVIYNSELYDGNKMHSK